MFVIPFDQRQRLEDQVLVRLNWISSLSVKKKKWYWLNAIL